MLHHDTAKQLYDTINNAVAEHPDSDKLYQRFLESAVECAGNRARWGFLEPVQRIQQSRSRSVQRDVFIALLRDLSGSLEVNLEPSLPDPETKGDFACYIALFLSLEHRNVGELV